MGIQSWKRGLHSGNTIRMGGSLVNQNQSTPPLLIKRSSAPSTPSTSENNQTSTEIKTKRSRGRRRSQRKTREDERQRVESEELEELEENVFYSLNKKGRWNLPEKLKKEIKYTKQSVGVGKELAHNVTLVECHSQKTGSNCIDLYSTKLPGDGRVSKSRTYINSESFLKSRPKTRQRQTKRRRKSSNTETEKQKSDDLPAVEVQVSYKHPTNFFNFSEKMCKKRVFFKDTLEKPLLLDGDFLDTIDCFDSDEEPSSCEDNDYLESLNSKDTEDRKVKSKNVSESKKEEYVWFLAEFVRTDSDDEASDVTNEEQNDKENERTKKDFSEIVQSNISFEDGWEIVEENSFSCNEKLKCSEDNILGHLIDAALARKASASSHISQNKPKRR